MGLMEMTGNSLAFSYKVLGGPAQMTLPDAAEAQPVRVIYSVDGTALIDGMVQSIGPSLRIRLSEAPAGVPRGTVFALASGTWKAREGGLPHNDGNELLVQLGKA